VQGAAEPARVGADAGQLDRRSGVRAKMRSTGTIPGTVSAGGSTQAGTTMALDQTGWKARDRLVVEGLV
jgi:hypothetical protein